MKDTVFPDHAMCIHAHACVQDGMVTYRDVIADIYVRIDLHTGTKAHVLTDIRKGTYLIKLSNGVNALAHSNYSRKNILRNDIVAFVVNRIDNKTVMVTGNIIRLIRSGRK